MAVERAVDEPYGAGGGPISIAICGGVVGRNAVGDQAIIYGIIKSLRREFGSLTVYLLSHDSDLQFELPDCDVRVIDQNRCSFLEEAAILRQCSLMVIAMAVFAYRHSLRRLASAALARASGTPVMVWGVELSAPKNLRHRLALRALARAANVITVRDQRSLDVAHGAGKKDARFTADPTFVLSPDAGREVEAQQVLRGLGLDPRRRIVALCPRKLIAGLWHPFSADTIENLVTEFARLVTELQAAGIQVVLVQMSPDQPDDDAVVIDEIIARLAPDQPRPAVLAWRPELPRLMIDIFAESDATVAVRLHGAILAMLAGKPAMTIAYEPKVQGIMDAVGLSEHVLPVEGFDGHHCAEAVLGWLETPDEVGRRIDASMEQIRARAWYNSQHAVRLIGDRPAGPSMRQRRGGGADRVAGSNAS